MDQFYTLLQTNFITSADILSINVNVFNNPSMLINVVMILAKDQLNVQIFNTFITILYM